MTIPFVDRRALRKTEVVRRTGGGVTSVDRGYPGGPAERENLARSELHRILLEDLDAVRSAGEGLEVLRQAGIVAQSGVFDVELLIGEQSMANDVSSAARIRSSRMNSLP